MIQTLLNGNTNCACGREHTCDIQHVVVRPGAVEALATLCEEYSNILLVADENTYATCGARVEEILGARMAEKIIFSGKTLLIPNEEAIARVEEVMPEKTDLILGIGSGVVNDLCKHVSFQHDLRYFIVATAPSMDGYASRRPSGLRKTRPDNNSLAHRTTWLRSDLAL